MSACTVRRRAFLHWSLLALPLPLLAACSGPRAEKPARGAPNLRGALTAFAAASLSGAFQEIGAAFQTANPGQTVSFNFAGSPTLRAQLAQGARADLFASADVATMRGAQQDGSIAGPPRMFATNRLAVIVPAANPAAITTLHDLAKPGLKLVLAQPNVPVGTYAREALGKMARDSAFGSGFGDAVLRNVVDEEPDVKQVVAKVQLGEADAGVVYRTDVPAANPGPVMAIDIPDPFNVVAEYPIASTKGAPNPAGAAAFIAYLLSPVGQGVLAGYGFGPPAAGTTGDG